MKNRKHTITMKEFQKAKKLLEANAFKSENVHAIILITQTQLNNIFGAPVVLVNEGYTYSPLWKITRWQRFKNWLKPIRQTIILGDNAYGLTKLKKHGKSN